ncbi:glycerophosphodiester phosphodiesterase family protein [Mesobacillus maritimus]|uniref:Glycerophosphodiester phosphodiesterase n=1 Tax=Mesobacillus maritimus TaxID=1643336 RepID=A0ABS7K892_9BACI|nr:glycerophosphodiester phosphodiesterase family protein [Mesobacillus maritimus]MBY0098440.1 glycerophosphodiester phosphodiesterase [Mesobacillus maritimus]
MKGKKRLKIVGWILLLLILFIYLNNSTLLMKNTETKPTLLAHRGMAQTFSMEGIEWDTCTAERIYPPEHPFIENTLPSIKAAFDEGADSVEFDVKRTKDNQFAVFHDHELSCRTNGKGAPSDYTMEELKQLDVGYGYTADNGETYPFRGKGVRMMPSIMEVLSQFPDKKFLIHIKSSDREDGELLAKYIEALPEEQQSMLTVYGDDGPVELVEEKLPELRVMSMNTMKNCMIPYLSLGWTGYIPAECENTQIHLPEKYAPFIWGWPDKFIKRMESVNTKVVIVAGDGGWSEGFDEKKDLERLPANFGGEIWTNRIYNIAPILK